uniref:Uncharacterized protein n=1 Tax=Ditylenchus dipsaci TaxID=166011 RepID=A0A915DLX1_9BILA
MLSDEKANTAGEKKANIDDRGRANIQELHNWLIETHKIKQQASMLEDDDRVKHLQGAENELKKALRNIRTAEMEKQKAVAGGDYDRAADISLNLKSYKSAASLKHDLSRDDLRLLSGLKPAGMFPLSTKSIGLDMQEDILGSSRTRKVGSSKTRLSNTRKTNQIEEEDSEDEFPRDCKLHQQQQQNCCLFSSPSTRREESFKSEVRDESRENTWMSSNDLMPPPTIDSRHSPNSETKSDSRQERFPIPPPALSHSHGEGWLLNQVNPSDRGYARKAIGLFGLKTVSNIYAIDWKKRCMAMKYIQERMGKLKTQTDAKHMMHMAFRH